MKVGYLRSAASAEEVEALLAQLESNGCQQIFVGSPAVPPNRDGTLSALLRRLKEGDTLIVGRFSCVAESLPQFIGFVTELGGKGVGFESLDEEFSTSGKSKGVVLATFGQLYKFEHELQKHGVNGGEPIRPRTGRPRVLTDADAQRAHSLVFGEGRPVERVAREMGVSRATLYRYLEEVRS